MVYFKEIFHSWSSRTPMVFMLTFLRSTVSSSTPDLVADIESRKWKWLRHVIKMIKQRSLRQFLKATPLWSSGQSSWLLSQRSRVRFPELRDFLRNNGSRTGSTQPREDN
jgi:hypothetical protein